MNGFEIQAEAEEMKEKRLDEIEKELQRMKMEWVEMYDKVTKLIDDKKW